MAEGRALDCTSKDFIKRYFATSRLHHLSTWKSELAEFVAGKMKDSVRASTARTYRSSPANEPFRTIMHIDMDCFFASVGIRSRPHLVGKPVAVAHSQGGLSLDYSTSEIASCNYAAREKGVKNGTFIGSAKELCPDLVIIPYEFEAYDACSKVLYQTLLDSVDFVQSVSCDEAYIDVTYIIQKKLLEHARLSSARELERAHQSDSELHEVYEQTASSLAEQLRQTIYASTQCHASVGIASNMLLARIATQKAKPNGVHSLLHHDRAVAHLRSLAIRDLPGVGYSTAEKCAQLQLYTCADAQSSGGASSSSSGLVGGGGSSGSGGGGVLNRLRAELGDKIGEMVYNFCWGTDTRILENKARQTVGADINWGIRFTNQEQVETFLREFSTEVYSRLEGISQTAKHVTVNVKKKDYEGEPGKYLGCGRCIDYSRSMVPGRAITSAEALYRCVTQLYKEIGVQPLDARGIGIHLKKLQPQGVVSLFRAMPSASSSGAAHVKPQSQAVWTRSDSAQSGVGPGRADHVGYIEEDEAGDDQECADILESTVVERPVREWDVREKTDSTVMTQARSGVGAEDDTYKMMSSVGGKEMASKTIKDAPAFAGVDASQTSIAPRATSTAAAEAPATRRASASGEVLNMGDIDLEVFMALPEDIQRELQASLGGSSGGGSSAGSAIRSGSTGQVSTGGTAGAVGKRKAAAGSAASNKKGKEGVKQQSGLLDKWIVQR